MRTISAVFLCFSISPILSYNFLVYNPMFAVSHMKYLSTIADILTEEGHNVTVLMPIVDPSYADKTFLKATKDVIKFEVSNETVSALRDVFDKLQISMWTETPGLLYNTRIEISFSEVLEKLCRDIASNTNVMNELRSRGFHVGIAEPIALCGFGLFDELGLASSLAATSTPPLDGFGEMLGQPAATQYVPGAMASVSDRMSVFERLENTIQYRMNSWTSRMKYSREWAAIRKAFGDNGKTAEQVLSEITYQFINTSPLVDFPFPTLQKNVQIGGITMEGKKPQQLNEKYDRILGLRPKTVLVSFGSIALSCEMPEEYKLSLLRVFQSMPNTTFIWKYENETTIADHLENVFLEKWTPQDALLADTRLSMFVTHGGLGSTTELAYSGKPAVMIPLFADQVRNSKMLSRHGGAVYFSKIDVIDPTKVRKTFENVLYHDSYAKNAKRLSEMLKNPPITPRKLLVQHCEFAARFGRLPHMDPYGRRMNFIQYYLIDIAFICLVPVLVFVYISFRVFNMFYSRKSKLE